MTVAALNQRYTINGVLSTDDRALSNLEKIAAACACWITYDVHAGLWSVVINRAGTSVKSFDDTNIIGGIDLQTTGLTGLYNKCKVTYPRADINDVLDYIELQIPVYDRFVNEPDNSLEMRIDLCNNPVQAQLLGLIELKQNRVDKLIAFQTDYSSISLNVGDIIDITNNTLGFTQKLFRVVSLRELDDDDGAIRLEISALEYDPAVYSTTDLVEYQRIIENGIKTINDLAEPPAPTVSEEVISSLPTVTVSAVVPDGVVEAMQFWVADTSPSSPDTSYQLAGTVTPEDEGAKLTPGTTVTFVVTDLPAGEYSWKVRAVNGSVAGPLSDSTASTVFERKLVPDNILPGTLIITPDGNTDYRTRTDTLQETPCFDLMYFPATGTFQPAIFQIPYLYYEAYNDIPQITVPAPFIPFPGIFTIDVSWSGVLWSSALAARGREYGMALWYNSAWFNLALFNAGGVPNLNWGAWRPLTWWYDSTGKMDIEGDFTANDSRFGSITAGRTFQLPAPDEPTDALLISFGLSTQYIPNSVEAAIPYLNNTVAANADLSAYFAPGYAVQPQLVNSVFGGAYKTRLDI